MAVSLRGGTARVAPGDSCRSLSRKGAEHEQAHAANHGDRRDRGAVGRTGGRRRGLVGPTRRGSPPAATGVTTAPTPTAGPTTPQPQTMTVRVFFHEQAPGPESDPGRVVPVSRTVPRSLKVATAALNELLRGPTTRERAAGYWSFFSDDTAGMLRGVRVTGGTGFADFRDVRRLHPQRHQQLRQHRVAGRAGRHAQAVPDHQGQLVRLQRRRARVLHLAPAGTPVDADGHLARDRAAPIAGRDGAAAVWTGRQLLVWGGHGRTGSQGLHPLRDGAAYDPAGDRWQPIPNAPAGVQGTSAAAAWTGSKMLVWLGNAPDGPAVGRPTIPPGGHGRPIAPSPIGPRESFSTIWTGYELIVFGGAEGTGSRHRRGGL